MTDPAFAEEFDMTVTEITDQYVAGEFEGEERQQVENYFFRSAERRAKLNIALGLKHQRSHNVRKPSSRLLIALPIAASFLLFAGVSYTIVTFMRNAEYRRGIEDLRAATQDRRPVRSRISGLEHANFSQTRGGPETNAQQERLRLAELNLKAALEKNPSPEVHHALGQTYLAQGQFDAAITQLNQALAGTSANARIYSDLGAAWFEKAKASPQITSGAAQPSSEDLARSLENLNKALQLDSSLQEALFNRAMVYESLGKTEQAKTDWREYLKRESTGAWADEARRNLQSLESRP
jgi:tetratricopeptide (TPR) repeat protein